MPGRRKEPSRVLVLAISVVVLAVVAMLDYVTRPPVSIVPFYLVPVSMVTWFLGRRAGIVMAGVCAGVWLGVNLTSGDISAWSFPPYWNAFAAGCGFAVVGLLVHARRELGKKVEEMVEEKTVALTAEVAERKRAEEAVHRLAAQLSEAEDVERRRLAHDIHDALGQTLTVLKMNLEASMEDTDERRAGRIKDSLSIIETMIQQTRTMTFALYPAMLDDLGLVPTVRRYGEQIQAQTGIQTTISEMGVGRKLPTHVGNYLFRAIKELINNARKHGKAGEVLITVHWRGEGGLRVVVDDDGCGFDVGAALSPQSHRGLGLASIKERVASLGGETHIESSEGNGTRVIMELPAESEKFAEEP